MLNILDQPSVISRSIKRREIKVEVGTIVLIILVIALLGGFSGLGGGPFTRGYTAAADWDSVLVIVLILVLLGKL